MWYDRREFDDTTAIHIVPGDRYENGAIVSDAGTLWRRVFFAPTSPLATVQSRTTTRRSKPRLRSSTPRARARVRSHRRGRRLPSKFALALSRDDFDERDFEVIDWRNSAEGEGGGGEPSASQPAVRPVDEGLPPTGNWLTKRVGNHTRAPRPALRSPRARPRARTRVPCTGSRTCGCGTTGQRAPPPCRRWGAARAAGTRGRARSQCVVEHEAAGQQQQSDEVGYDRNDGEVVAQVGERHRDQLHEEEADRNVAARPEGGRVEVGVHEAEEPDLAVAPREFGLLNVEHRAPVREEDEQHRGDEKGLGDRLRTARQQS